MSAAKQVREAIAAALAAAGVETAQEYEKERFSKLSAPIAVIGGRRTSIRAAGMLDYLGERWNEAQGTVEEVYGRGWKLTVSFDLFSPRTAGAAPCEELSETLTQVLLTALPAGLRMEELRWEETAWDRDYGLFSRRGSADFSAYFLAAAAEDETVVADFILKGVIDS